MFFYVSFHRYMAEHHTSSEDEAPTKRLTRGATRLRQLLIRRAKGQKTHVDINVDTGEPSGRYVEREYQSLHHLLIMSLKLIGK